jgi:hypothetical protein
MAPLIAKNASREAALTESFSSQTLTVVNDLIYNFVIITVVTVFMCQRQFCIAKK